MPGFFLVLALAALGVGGLLKMRGQWEKNQAEKAALERQLPVYEAQQAAIKAQMRGLEQTAAIEERQLQRQGAIATGSVLAAAGVGNVGGASIERRVQGIQTQVSEERAKREIQLGVNTLQAGANLLTSQVNQANVQANIEFIQKYGNLEVAAIGLGTIGNMVNVGAGGIPAYSSEREWPEFKRIPKALALEDYDLSHEWGH